MKVVSLNTENNLQTSKEGIINVADNAFFQKGQVVEGVISKVSDMISITFSGQEYKLSKSAVQNAKEGDIRQFEITDVSEKSIVLKEVGNSTDSEYYGVASTKVEVNQSVFTNKNRDGVELAKAKEKAENVSKQLDRMGNQMSNQDYSDLSKESDDLEEYNLDRLDRAIKRVKEQRQFREDQLDKQIDKKEEYRDQVEDIAVKQQTDSGKNQKIKDRLEQADIPVTQSNIDQVTMAMNEAQSIPNLTDGAMAGLISKKEEPTVENIYKSMYGNGGNYYVPKTAGDNESAWKQVEPQAENIIKNSGLTVDDNTIQAAKWLFNHELPIDQNSLALYQQLMDMKADYNEDQTLGQIVQGMVEGQNPEQVVIGEDCIAKAEQLVADVNQISNEAVNQTVKENQTVTLGGMMEAQQQGYTKDTDVDIQAVKAHRQLEEIRLKLTVENAYQLLKQGVDVDTSELQNVIDQLKGIEDDYYKSVLSEQNVEDSNENIAVLRDTTQTIQQLANVPNVILGSTLERKKDITVASLYAEGEEATQKFQQMNERYETLMTRPRKDMGDSMQKAFRNVDDILDNMGLDKTQANQRAVRILGYNSMEITKESIDNVKEYDSKVNYLLKSMTPSATISLIKENINPLQMPVDELNEKLKEINEKNNDLDSEKYSEYLYNLEKNNEITDEERNSYIGIYRLLHQVEQSDGAVVGSLMETNQEITLQNMLTAVRIRKNAGIDTKVDDTMGTAEKAATKGMKIDDQVNASFDNINYYQTTANQLFDSITADVMTELGADYKEKGINLKDVPVDQLYEDMMETDPEEVTPYTQYKMEQIRNLASQQNQEMILTLNANDVDVTIQNLITAGVLENENAYEQFREYFKNQNKEDANDIDEQMDTFVDDMVDEDSLQKVFSSFEENVNNAVNGQVENQTLDYETLAHLKQMNANFALLSSYSRNEYYEVPMKVNDEVATVKLSIIHNQDEKGKVQIKTQVEEFGNISIDLYLDKDQVDGMILCDSSDGINTLAEKQDILDNQMESMGMSSRNITYHLEQSVKNKKIEYPNSQKKDQSVDTKSLYQLAKQAITYIKEVVNN